MWDQSGYVTRVDFGYFVRPASETGTGAPRAEACLGYLVCHPDGLVLVDTGMGFHPDVDAHYHPVRRPLQASLEAAGVRLDDLKLVVNCHLHFDHCGGNPLLGTTPIVAQRVELEVARGTEYTLPELVDTTLNYLTLDGATELLPDLHVIPTPGHSPGHQSLVYRTPDGTLVVAGQCFDTANHYATALLNRTAHNAGDDPLPETPDWLDTLRGFDPRLVVFAHDHSAWLP
jgi:N-acyl homoserine lactone hydrolase